MLDRLESPFDAGASALWIQAFYGMARKNTKNCPPYVVWRAPRSYKNAVNLAWGFELSARGYHTRGTGR